MRNLGPVSKKWLAEIGINTIDELRNKGALEAYIEMKALGIQSSLNLLWALHGAIHDIHWTEVTEETKRSYKEKLRTIEG